MQNIELPASILKAGFPKRAVKEWFTIRETALSDPTYAAMFNGFADKLTTGCMIGMIGKRGVGKTVLTVGLAAHALIRKGTIRYTTGHEFFMDIKDSYRRDASESERDVVEGFRDPKLLIIDEIGRRQETEWENRTLFHLLDHRYGDMRDTILISNQTSDVFEDAIGDSVVSRMNECGGIVEIPWPSFRA